MQKINICIEHHQNSKIKRRDAPWGFFFIFFLNVVPLGSCSLSYLFCRQIGMTIKNLSFVCQEEPMVECHSNVVVVTQPYSTNHEVRCVCKGCRVEKDRWRKNDCRANNKREKSTKKHVPTCFFFVFLVFVCMQGHNHIRGKTIVSLDALICPCSYPSLWTSRQIFRHTHTN